MQTGLELVWPIIENILEGELNIDPKKIEEIRKNTSIKTVIPKSKTFYTKKELYSTIILLETQITNWMIMAI